MEQKDAGILFCNSRFCQSLEESKAIGRKRWELLLRKEDMANYPEIYIYIAPFVGVVVYAAAYLFWQVSVRRYCSMGIEENVNMF